MKTLYLTRLAAMALLACVTVFLVSCGQAEEEKDTGPNASLSNEELLKKAITNMGALRSYHVEFENQVPDFTAKTITDKTAAGYSWPLGWPATMTADIQFTQSTEPEAEKMVLNYSSVVNMDIIVTGGHWYESADEGKTWLIPSSDSGGAYLAMFFIGLWETSSAGTGRADNIIRDIDAGIVLRDGSPRKEQIGGVTTRHIAADVEASRGKNLAFFGDSDRERIKRADFWVTTDATPMVRQIRWEGSTRVRRSSEAITPTTGNDSKQEREVAFKATWKWSRFNEDFGEVKPPPAETIKSP